MLKHMKRMKMYNAVDLLKEDLKNPVFKTAYEKLTPKYKIIRAFIDARLRSKLTQKELALKLGTKQSAISRFESGKNMNPTFGLLYNLANELGLEVEIRLKTK